MVRFFGPIIDQINNFGEVLKHFRERLEVVEKRTPAAPASWSDNSEVNAELLAVKAELDEVRQRSMKGNLIVTSKERIGKNGSKIPSRAQKSGGESDLQLVLRLIKEKSNVDVPSRM